MVSVIASLRSLQWADFYIYSLTDPRALLRAMGRNESGWFWPSFIVPFMVAVTAILSSALLSGNEGIFYYRITYGLLLLFLYYAARTVVIAAMIDLAAQMSGLEGAVKSTIGLLNYAIFPRTFLLPLLYIVKVLHFAPSFFSVFFLLLLSLWSWYTMLLGLSEMHQIPVSKAFVLFIFPSIFFFLFTLFGAILLASFFSGIITTM